MERDYAMGIVQREADRVLQLANTKGHDNDNGAGGESDGTQIAHLAARVPSCPEWDFAQLVQHLGNVYNWVGTIVEGRLLAPPGAEIAQRPDDMSATAWLADRLDRLLRALTEVPADAAV